jgi:disulfide oxidoreductase YuzD
MERRFGDAAEIVYFDTSKPEVKALHADVIEAIQSEGLIYPVTVIAGRPVYDGAVSYPAIIRSVEQLLAAQPSES